MNKLIAIVGMCGTGKSIATDYLEEKGYVKLHFGNITYKLMAQAGIKRTEDGKSEKEFRENLRKQYGKACYAKFLEEDIKKSLKTTAVVLDGLYSWDEYKYLIERFPNLKLIAIITDKNLRYERIANRKDRPFNKTDVTYRDITEIENLAKGGPIAYADYYLLNNGSLDEYYNQLEEIIKNIEKHEGE